MNVRRGDLIGLSGASGFGSDWGYGAHVHQTLWPGEAWAAPTIDFELYVGDEPPPEPPPEPPDEEDEEMTMKGAYYTRAVDGETYYLLFNEVSGQWVEHSGADAAYNNEIAQYWHTDSWARLTESHAKVLKTSLTAVQPKPTTTGATGTTSSNPLVTPAWIAGFFLGLIGLVEVVRFVVDLLV
jgi:murein DD-endopeptidase